MQSCIQDHGTSLSDGDYYGNYAVYLTSDDKAFPCEGATLDNCMGCSAKKTVAAKKAVPAKKTVWKLAVNVNPSDGNNFGYGGPWATDALVGWGFQGNILLKNELLGFNSLHVVSRPDHAQVDDSLQVLLPKP